MRTVTFVKSLNIEEVPLIGDSLQYHQYPPMDRTFHVGDAMAVASETITSRVVPVHEICKGNGEEIDRLYIAYSDEVKELLDMPFDTLSNELHASRDYSNKLFYHLSSFKNASLWNRIKYLFGKWDGNPA